MSLLGGVKLISFNSALKLAADSNVDVPRSVYEEYEKYSTKVYWMLCVRAHYFTDIYTYLIFTHLKPT